MRYKQLEPPQNDGGMDPGLWDTLPDEIIDRILAFLPLPCFFRLQVVCKRWNSLRFSPGFLDVYSEVVTPRPWLLLFAKGKERSDVPRVANLHKLGVAYNFLLKRVSFLYNTESRKWYNLALPCLPPQASILAASGGLLCCEGGMGYFLVCNPVTNTWRPLPPSFLDRNTIQFAMVTEQSTKSYMVIAVGGSFLCPPGKTNSNDYRIRLVLNRLRTSSFGGRCSRFPAPDSRGYPGFPLAYEHHVPLPCVFGASSVGEVASNLDINASNSMNQRRVLRSAPTSRVNLSNMNSIDASQLDTWGGSPAHEPRSAHREPCQSSSEVPLFLRTSLESLDDQGSSQATKAPPRMASSSSCDDATSSQHEVVVALDRLHISTPRISRARAQSFNLPSLVCLGDGNSRSEDASILEPIPRDQEDALTNRATNLNKDSQVTAFLETLKTDDSDSTCLTHKNVEEHQIVQKDDQENLAGATLSQNFASSSLLPPVPVSPSYRFFRNNEQNGLRSLSTSMTQSTSPTLWRLGENDDSVGLASILDHANWRLSRDSQYHMGQAFNTIRDNLLCPSDISQSEHSVGIVLNRMRSNVEVSDTSRSGSSEHYGFTIEVYDSKIGRWERAGLLPKEVDSISRTSYCNGSLYCLAFNLVQIFKFNIVERSWTSIEMPRPFFFIVPDLVELNGRLLLVGGVREVSLKHCIITWELDQSKFDWKEVVRMPDELCKEFHRGEHFQVFSCVGNGSLLFFMSENIPRVLVFDFDKKSWDWSPTCHGIESRFLRGFKGFCFQPRLDALV